MTTATAEKQTTALVAPTANVGRELDFGMDREKVALIKRTVARGATDDQFALFMVTAQRLGLDVFAKQIYCVIRDTKDGPVMAIQTGIDGYRAIAARTNEYDGQEGPFWCGEDGEWKDVWLPKTPPRAAKVVVYRKGSSRPFVGIATWDSYVQIGRDSKPTGQWPRMPDVMLAKCAEALALRKALPMQMSGVYVDAELDHAGAGAIDAAFVEKLPTVAAEAQVDTWAAFLADLATVPAAADVAGDFATEGDITAAVIRLFDAAPTRRAFADAVGPWMAVIERHARISSRVAAIKEALAKPGKARQDALREAEKAAKPTDATAQNGATP